MCSDGADKKTKLQICVWVGNLPSEHLEEWNEGMREGDVCMSEKLLCSPHKRSEANAKEAEATTCILSKVAVNMKYC